MGAGGEHAQLRVVRPTVAGLPEECIAAGGSRNVHRGQRRGELVVHCGAIAIEEFEESSYFIGCRILS